jgi:plasmid stabilization system protein ParE
VTTANKVYLKPKAYEDLESIYNYSVFNFGETKAIEYINNIDLAFSKLSKDDISGKTCDYIKVNLLKLNVNSHVVLFKLMFFSFTLHYILAYREKYFF